MAKKKKANPLKKKCSDCGNPTTDYYPIKGGIRCNECQERFVRTGYQEDKPAHGSYKDRRR